MKFKYFTLIFLLLSCTNHSFEKSNVSPSKISKGFALIYNESDFENKIISSKLNSNKIEAAHNQYKKNTIIIITNPENKKSVQLLVSKKVNYPDFFKVLITKELSEKLNLNQDMPFVEVERRKKNKSFIAKKAVTYSEEQSVLTKAPVTKVKINNISKSSNDKTHKKLDVNFSIIIGEFYSKKWASSLVELLINENIQEEVFSIKSLGKNNYQLIAGPYTSINTLKNDYFKLNKYGFDNLDIKKNK